MFIIQCSKGGSDSIQIMADDPRIVNINELRPTPSNFPPLRTRDEQSGNVVEYSFKDYILNIEQNSMLHNKFALVMFGGSGVGKTAAALSALSIIAKIHMNSSDFPPYVIKVGTTDVLSEAVRLGIMGKGVPILFDEISASKPSGTRPPLGLENTKRLTEVEKNTTLAARFKDVSIFPNQAKIFTCNETSPHAWLNEIPPNIFTMSNADFLALNSSVVAVIRRTLFCHITVCVIPDMIRAAYRAHINAQDVAVAIQSLGEFRIS